MDQQTSESQPIVIGCDTETRRFAPGCLIPKLVCIQVSMGDQQNIVLASSEQATALLEFLFPAEAPPSDAHIVFHNAAFDLAVMAGFNYDLMARIFASLDAGRIHDTRIREKLLNLSLHGKLDMMPGNAGRISYHLSDLVQKYKGITLEKATTKNGEVVGEADAWRLNFDMLENTPVEEWPAGAVQYALDDAVYAEQIYALQEIKRQEIIAERGFDPFATEGFHVAVDFCLYLCSAWGIAVDPVTKSEIECFLKQELAEEKMAALINSGVLRPAEPPRPMARGVKDHKKDCIDPKICQCPPKMTKPVPESINQTVLRNLMVEICNKKGCPELIEWTPPSERFPEGQISVKGDWFSDNAGLDPIFAQYAARAELQKLVSTELPRMEWPNGSGITSPVVHPCYDVLKETGRTSAYASEAYPSFNIQNVDPRARGCFVPRPGTLLFSCDFGQMELVTLAQTCLSLFGKSVLAEKIKAGIDPHAYLGAQLCFKLHPEFQQSCLAVCPGDPDSVFRLFSEMKKHPEEAVRDLYKHYRNMAKPTGLGYPGGLGPKTFVAFAKHPYNVNVTLEEATELREIWFETYPEMRAYFDYINNECQDPWNPVRIFHDKATGQEREIKPYVYQSPMGMFRVGCDYCAACNGQGLQTPGAEGAKLALYNVTRACYDPTLNSVLLGNERPIGFIHDEILGETPAGDGSFEARKFRHDRMMELAKIMVESFKAVCPDVPISAKPVLMDRWNKDAEQVFDSDGFLDVWRPNAA